MSVLYIGVDKKCCQTKRQRNLSFLYLEIQYIIYIVKYIF